MNILAKNLKFLRDCRGLSIYGLSDAVQLDAGEYGAWEQGDALPQAESLKKLTDFYELDIKEAFSKTFIEDYVFVHPETSVFDPDSSDYQGDSDFDGAQEDSDAEPEEEDFNEVLEEEPEEDYGESGEDYEEAEHEESDSGDFFEVEEPLDDDNVESELEDIKREFVPRASVRRSRKPASRFLDSDEDEEKRPPRVRAYAQDDGDYIATQREMYVPIGRKSSKKTKAEPRKRAGSRKPKSRARVALRRNAQSPLWEQIVSNEKIRRAVLDDTENTVLQRKEPKALSARDYAKRISAPAPVLKKESREDVISSEDVSKIGAMEYDMTAYDMPDMNVDPDLFKPEFKQIDYKNQAGTFDTDTGDRTDLTAEGGTSLSRYFDEMTSSSGVVQGDEALAANVESDYEKITAPEQEPLDFKADEQVGENHSMVETPASVAGAQPDSQSTPEAFKSQPEEMSSQPQEIAGQPADGWTVIYQDNRVVDSEAEINTPIEGQQSLFSQDVAPAEEQIDGNFGAETLVDETAFEQMGESDTGDVSSEEPVNSSEEVASYNLESFDEKNSEAQQSAEDVAAAASGPSEVVLKKPLFIKNIFTTNDNPIAIALCLAVVMLLSLFLPMVRDSGETFIGFVLFGVDIIRAILVIVLAIFIIAFMIDILVTQYKVLAAQNVLDKRFAKAIKRNSILYAVVSLVLVVSLLVLSLADFEIGIIVLGVVEFFFALSCILIASLTRRVKAGSRKRAIIKHNSYQIESNLSKIALIVSSVITLVLWVLLVLFVIVGILQTVGGQNVLQQIGIANAGLWWIAELFAGLAAMFVGNYFLIAVMAVVLLGILGLQISNFILFGKYQRGEFDKAPHTAAELSGVRRHGIINLSIGTVLYIAAMATLLGLMFADFSNTAFAYEYGLLIILTAIGMFVAYKFIVYIRLYKCFKPIDGDSLELRLFLEFNSEGNLGETQEIGAGAAELEKVMEENKTAGKFAEARENLARTREAQAEGVDADTETFEQSEQVHDDSGQLQTELENVYEDAAQAQPIADESGFDTGQSFDTEVAEIKTEEVSEPETSEVKAEPKAEGLEDTEQIPKPIVEEEVLLAERAEPEAFQETKGAVQDEIIEKDTIDDILDRIEKEINSKVNNDKGGDDK